MIFTKSNFTEYNLKDLIENEDSESQKLKYLLKLIDKIKISKFSFAYFEELFISESSSLIRLTLLKFLCQFFPKWSIEPINWVMEKEPSFFNYLFSNLFQIQDEKETLLKLTKNTFLKFILQNRDKLVEYGISFYPYKRCLKDKKSNITISEKEGFKSDQFRKSKKFKFTQVKKCGKLIHNKNYYIPIYQESYRDNIIQFYLIHYRLFNSLLNLICDYFSLEINDFRFFLEKGKNAFLMISNKCELIVLFSVIMGEYYQTKTQHIRIEEY